LRGIGAALVALELEVVAFALYGAAHWYVPLLAVLATAFAFIAGTVRIARCPKQHRGVRPQSRRRDEIVPEF
jgi:hypothetical protein